MRLLFLANSKNAFAGWIKKFYKNIVSGAISGALLFKNETSERSEIKLRQRQLNFL